MLIFKGMSQADLAHLLEARRTTIADYENSTPNQIMTLSLLGVV